MNIIETRRLSLTVAILAGLTANPGCASRQVSGGKASNPPPATAPGHGGGTSGAAVHSASTAPVLVVWHKPMEGEAPTTSRVEYAAWPDGIVLYRRDFPKAPRTLMVGRVEASDVQNALHAIEGKGFFRTEPFRFAPAGTVIMARSGGKANSLTTYQPLMAMTAAESPKDMAQYLSLWNTIVESVESLRETSDSEDIRALVDGDGLYRGYNNTNPSATWWFADSGELWKPESTVGPATSGTKPAH